MTYVSLHNYTEYSILYSLLSSEEIFKKAKENNMTSLAITERGTFASLYNNYKLSKKYGIKLIVGCEFFFSEDPKSDEKLKTIILLAKNAEGYKNLLNLHFDGFYTHDLSKKAIPVINWELLKKYAAGNICLTSGGNGIISFYINNKDFAKAEDNIIKLKEIFNEDFGIEIQANNHKCFDNYYTNTIDQVFTNNKLIKFARTHNIKLIPTSNSFYLDREDADKHDALLAIGCRQPTYSNSRLKFSDDNFWFKNEEDIKAFFSRNYGDEFAEEIVSNTKYFSDLCEDPKFVDLKSSNPSGKELPEFNVKEANDYNEFLIWRNNRDGKEDELYLRYKCEINFDKRLGNIDKKIYWERIEEELDVFSYCGVSSYMLIVADYVEFARNSNIPVGPGRGSVAGSLVGYLLNIHQADPIKYGLIFSRFFNKAKSSYADIDLDFSTEDRYKVFDYIIKKYGKRNTAMISSVIEITPKVYTKDLIKVKDLGNDRKKSIELADKVADTITSGPHGYKDIDECISKSPLFVEYVKRYPALESHRKICNKARAYGTHPAGMIISKRDLPTIAPLRVDKDNNNVIEYDKDLVEEIGLVKLDVLVIENLDIIKKTKELIAESGLNVPNINYEDYDKKTYDLISSGDTFCVFQFGASAETIGLCKKVKPKCIEDLATITTLARPVTKDFREDYIEAIHGKREITYLHPILENALKPTYGFPMYDETLLVLAKDVAGWDLAVADRLRKFTKEKGKNPEKDKKTMDDFIEGSIKNGLTEAEAKLICEKVIIPYGRIFF